MAAILLWPTTLATIVYLFRCVGEAVKEKRWPYENFGYFFILAICSGWLIASFYDAN